MIIHRGAQKFFISTVNSVQDLANSV